MVFRWHGIPWVCCYQCCLERTVKYDTWMRMTSVTGVVIFFESGVLKVTWSQLRSNSPLSTITRHIDNSILKDIHNSIFYGHGSTCVLNLSSDFGKRHWNENQWRWMEKDQSRKNSSVHLAEYLNQNRNHVSHFVPLFFSQT